MLNDRRNINKKNELNDKSKELFSKLEIPWEKKKDELWDELESKMDEGSTKVVKMNTAWPKMAVAAIIILLISTALFMRFYTKTVSSMEGKHVSHVLPDGSGVNLNASSSISYHPYWWRFSRKVKLSGEGFFDVEKGKTFDVISENGITSVLGTSFNIYARNDEYIVTCVTGRVKVEALETGSKVILNPDEKAVLGKHGIFEISYEVNTDNTVSWISKQFIFTSVSLSRVIEEISRQYNVEIDYTFTEEFVYSGGFKKDQTVEEVLNLVCKPLGINFVAREKGVYELKQNN